MAPLQSLVAYCLGAIAAVILTLALAGASFAQQPAPASRIAAENAEISAQMANARTALDGASAELAQLRKATSNLDERMRQIDRRAQVHALGWEFAQTLLRELRELPRPGRFSAAHAERARLLVAASDSNLRVERALRELDDPDATAARPQADAAVRAALAEQRDLLNRLDEVQDKLVETLREADAAERDLYLHSQATGAKLNQILFWIPAPSSIHTIGEILPSLAWTTSPANWRAAAAATVEEMAHRPFPPTITVLVAVLLYALRGRLQRALVSIAPASVTFERYRIRHTLAALAITFALALPGPMVLWAAGTVLLAAPDGQPFVQALGDALSRSARLVLALSAFAWMLDRRGVAVSHFGWDETSLSFAARALRRFAALFVPLVIVAALNLVDHAPFTNRESLGRMLFSASMIACAAFLLHLLRRKSPLMQRLFVRAPRSWAASLHGLWLGALVAMPLAMAGLAATGYFVVAAYFFRLTLESLFFVLGALMLYGLIAQWVQVQRFQLVRRRDEETAQAAEARTAKEAGSEVAQRKPQRLDIAALGEQTRSLLDLFITLPLLGGLWWVWADALPVLSVIGDYPLWTYATDVAGKEVTRAVSVSGVFLALIVAGVTSVAVRNVGALLDIMLLERLEMRTDATYAIKVMTQYAIAAAGILAASRILGIGWNDVQWLIAALGVGLGFGLQEIVANFVSGLIILAERPIRIGDVVTVGNVTGTVSRIRARATVVVDFENKEVIIPNKSFITERVVNWSLSSQTTRLLITVSVASGSDIELAQRAMLDALRGNGDVLQEPPPSVLFVALRGNALDFEIRAFVDSLDKRLRVQHEIIRDVARVLRENGIESP